MASFTGKTSDGNTDQAWSGGPGTVWIKGTFDGAAVTVKSVKGGEVFDMAHQLVFDKNGSANFQIGACDIRFIQSRSGAATDLDYYIESASGSGPA